MSRIIDAIAVVDTKRLLHDHPSGLYVPRPSELGTLNQYFEMLVSPRSAMYTDVDNKPWGIKCDVADVINIRAISRSDSEKFVIIDRVSDYNRDAQGDSILEYLTAAEFSTAYLEARKYSEGGRHLQWNLEGWHFSVQGTERDGTVHDNFVQMTALQSTSGLSGNHIRYSLGFYIFSNGAWRHYGFDPYIRIDPS